MITFNNWVISNSGLIAYQFDNLSAYLEITGDIPTGWTWNLYLQSGANLNIVSLTETENGIGIELTAEMLALSGDYYIQLQGTQGDVVKHTNIIRVYIPTSLSGNVQWPTVPSEFTQVEQRIQTLNSNPPYPGDNGYWMIYDIDSGAYIQSSLPLPPVAEGPQGPAGEAATVAVSGTETLAPGEPSRVENVGTSSAAELKFYIPAGQDGAPGTPGQDGAPGKDGAPGQAATIQIGTVTDGDTAAVTNSGTDNAAVLDFVLPRGAQGESGPAGAGVPSIEGVPTNYVLTPGGWAPPSGGAEREWTQLGVTDCSQVSGNIIYSGLDSYTEFLVLAETVMNDSATASGYAVVINDVQITGNPTLKINNQSLGTAYYQWLLCKFNGFVWEVRNTAGAVYITNLAVSNGNGNYPYNFVLNVGASISFKLLAPLAQYQAVSGKITVWGR